MVLYRLPLTIDYTLINVYLIEYCTWYMEFTSTTYNIQFNYFLDVKMRYIKTCFFTFCIAILPYFTFAVTQRDNYFCFSKMNYSYTNDDGDKTSLKFISVENPEVVGYTITNGQPWGGLGNPDRTKYGSDCILIKAGRKKSEQTIDDTKKLLANHTNITWNGYNMWRDGGYHFTLANNLPKPDKLNFAVKLNFTITYKENKEKITAQCKNVTLAQNATDSYYVISNINNGNSDSSYLEIQCDKGSIYIRRYYFGIPCAGRNGGVC